MNQRCFSPAPLAPPVRHFAVSVVLIAALIAGGCEDASEQASANDDPAPLGRAQSIALPGLVVRAAPDLSAKRIALAPHRSKLAVLERGAEERAAGMQAPWYRVRIESGPEKGESGWVFGGFVLFDGDCLCRYTGDAIGSVYSSQCDDPPGLEDVGGALLDDSLAVGYYRPKGAANASGGFNEIWLTIELGRYKSDHACWQTLDVARPQNTSSNTADSASAPTFYAGEMHCTLKDDPETEVIGFGPGGSEGPELEVTRAYRVDRAAGKFQEVPLEKVECINHCYDGSCI